MRLSVKEHHTFFPSQHIWMMQIIVGIQCDVNRGCLHQLTSRLRPLGGVWNVSTTTFKTSGGKLNITDQQYSDSMISPSALTRTSGLSDVTHSC